MGSAFGRLLEVGERGLYCPAGDFWIDPSRPVPRAVLTHAHADHARPGSRSYLVAEAGLGVFRRRLGQGASIETLAWGETSSIDGVRVSFHPAGHLLGSAQVRLEHGGRVAVVTGDYKLGPDPTCRAFEPVACDLLVTESTFGLPIFRWPEPETVFGEIEAWWRENRARDRVSVLLAYSLGKAQRAQAGLPAGVPVFTHGAVENLNAAYREAGIALPPSRHVSSVERRETLLAGIVVAPPSAVGSPWMQRFGRASLGFCSGWMAVRALRRARRVDRGFVLSDHADWPGLLEAIEASGAEKVWTTHGYAEALARWLGEERGLAAEALTAGSGPRLDEEEEEEGEET